MNFAKMAALATAIAVLPVAANAQDVGATVFGNDDAPIGTVETNEAGIVTVNTGKHMAPLPANLLAEREGKWTVNATQAQIDGMMDAQVQAATDARDAALVTGAAAWRSARRQRARPLMCRARVLGCSRSNAERSIPS